MPGLYNLMVIEGSSHELSLKIKETSAVSFLYFNVDSSSPIVKTRD